MEDTKENIISEEEQKAYARACTEVFEILKEAPQEDIRKIPKELMDALELKKDREYKFKANSYTIFENEEISDIAKVILTQIFKEYIMKSEENIKNNEEDEKTLPTEIITNNIENSDEKQEEQVALVEVKKESLYKRIIKFLKKIFKLNRDEIEE